MIVEFVGCSRSGKSALIRKTYDELRARGLPARTPLQGFIGRRLAEATLSGRCEELLLDVLVLPWSISVWLRHRALRRVVSEGLAAVQSGFLTRALLLRSVARRLGVRAFLARPRFENEIVLVDEGTINVAQSLFARVPRGTDGLVRRYAELVPLPDVAVYLTCPVEVLEARSREKRGRPLMRRSDSPARTRAFLEDAARALEKVFGTPRVYEEAGILRFDGVDALEGAEGRIVDALSARRSGQ